MNKLHKVLASASVASCLFSVAAQAQTSTYAGNGATGFGGPAGDGSLSLTNDGSTLTGTFTAGGGTSYDELVIYISTAGTAASGSNSTAAFTDDGGAANGDILREAVSGYDAISSGGSTQAVVNFQPGFYANYAIALSPNEADYSGLYGLPGSSNSTATTGAFNFISSASLTPVGSTGTADTSPVAGPYTFSISLASLGLTSTSSFEFATTYLSSHTANTIYRSNEGFNTVTDETTPTNTGNPGTDTVLLGADTYLVPEPTTWAMMGVGLVLVAGYQRRRSRA